MANSSPRLLRAVRLTHLYVGVFIAPALLFFAFTGFIQTFGLHETTRGSNYKPPRILMELGQLHKKQTLVVPEKKPLPSRPDAVAKPADPSTPPDVPKPSPRPDTTAAYPKGLVLMKLFFALVALGLASSTLSGLYMAYQYGRNATVITVLWLAGILLPVLFTLL